MFDILEGLPDEVQEVLSIALITEEIEDVRILLNTFFNARPQYNRAEAFDLLARFNVRFNGLNGFMVSDYDFRNLSANSLYLTSKVAKAARDNQKKIRVILYD